MWDSGGPDSPCSHTYMGGHQAPVFPFLLPRPLRRKPAEIHTSSHLSFLPPSLSFLSPFCLPPSPRTGHWERKSCQHEGKAIESSWLRPPPGSWESRCLSCRYENTWGLRVSQEWEWLASHRTFQARLGNGPEAREAGTAPSHHGAAHSQFPPHSWAP